MNLSVSSPSSGVGSGGGSVGASPPASHRGPPSAPVFLEFRDISVQLKTRGRGAKPAPLQIASAASMASAAAAGGGAVAAPRAPRAVELLPSVRAPAPHPGPGLPSPPEFSFLRPQLTASDQFHVPARREAASAPAASRGAVGGGWADLPPAAARGVAQRASRQEGTPSGVSLSEEKMPELEGAAELSRGRYSFGGGTPHPSPPLAFSSPVELAVAPAAPAAGPASVPSPALVPAPTPSPAPVSPAKSFILNGVSGYALPGQLLAIMGASGSGKTTLLNVLSGRHSSSTCRVSGGCILVNQQQVPLEQLSRASAFVQQNDLLLASLTVYEIIAFAAAMKLPRRMSAAEKERRVSAIITELGLDKCKHLCVGSSGAGDADSSGGGGGGGGGSGGGEDGSASSGGGGGGGGADKSSSGISRSGISGGEQRRVSIGMELITDPQLLFLDEPTSGLDSSTAYTTISLLKRLAQNRGRTIVLTIHSPSSKIFALFDRLLLLTPYAGGGRVAYHGPAADALSYFETRLNMSMERVAASMGKARNVHMTAADFLLVLLFSRKRVRMMADGSGSRSGGGRGGGDGSGALAASASDQAALLAAEEEDEDRIRLIVEAYAAQPDRLPEELLLPAPADADGRAPGLGPAGASPHREDGSGSKRPWLHPGASASLPWLHQFSHLTHRSYLTHKRDLAPLRARLFTNVFLALFVGLLYLNSDRSTEAKYNSNYSQKSIFNRVGFIFFVTCMQALNVLVNAVLTFTEERTLFLRETSGKMYCTSAYFLSKMVLELPLNTALSFLFGLVGYVMVGMTMDGAYLFKFLLMIALLGHAVASIGLLLGAAVPIPIVAVMLCPLTVIPFMLTSGFFINLDTMPRGLSWLVTLSPHGHTFTALMGLEFRHLQLHCEEDEMNEVVLRADSPAPERFQYCSMIRGTQVLDLLSLPYDCYAQSVMALILIAIGFRIAAFAVLFISVRENKQKAKRWRTAVIKRAMRGIRAVADWCRTKCTRARHERES